MKTLTTISKLLLLVVMALTPLAATAGPAAHFIPDAQGRELVPGGFVAITEDRKGVITYTADDVLLRQRWDRQPDRLGLQRQCHRSSGDWHLRRPDIQLRIDLPERPFGYLVTTDDVPMGGASKIHLGTPGNLTVGSRLATGMQQVRIPRKGK